jgi:flagellar biosynthesis/type III secretory pathway M-ring protein FliF/YscJ
MVTITFIISIIALIISILAYRRTGGARELKKTVNSLSSSMESLKDRAGEELKERVEHLTSVTESLREKTADVIDRLEKTVRKEPEQKPPAEKSPEEKPSRPKRPKATED